MNARARGLRWRCVMPSTAGVPRVQRRRAARRPSRSALANSPDQSRSGRRPRRGVAADTPTGLQLAARRSTPTLQSCRTWPSRFETDRLHDLHRGDPARRAVPRRPGDDGRGRGLHVPAVSRSGVRVRPKGRLSRPRAVDVVDRVHGRRSGCETPSAAFPVNLRTWASSRGRRAPRRARRRSAAARTGSPSSCPTTTSRSRLRGLLPRRARERRPRRSRWCPTRRCAASNCATAASTSSSTTSRRIWCTACGSDGRLQVVTADRAPTTPTSG